MIVDPDFLDHWRTGMVADAINDPMAAIYILRLWGHCQDRKSDTFVMPTAGLKAQCKCPAPAEVFERALIDAGFLKRDGDTITVIGWAEKNASLLAAWENGSKGGRPKKNPEETHGKPTGNPTETHGQPIANPGETDKSREDKSTSSLRSEVGRASRLPQDWTLPDDWAEWCRSERPELDPTAVASSFRDYWVAKPGKDGRKADWLATWRNWVRNQRSAVAHRGTGPPVSKQSALEARNAATVARVLENLNAAQRTPEVS